MSQTWASLSDNISRWLNAIASTTDLVVDPCLLSKNGDLPVCAGPRVVENGTYVSVGSGGRRWWWCDGGRGPIAQSRSAEGECAGQGGGGCQGCWAHGIGDSEDTSIERIVDDRACLCTHTGRCK